MFFKGSRYQFVDTISLVAPDGHMIVYKKTRFFTPPAVRKAHEVTQGDRIDLIAYQFLRDPLQFWQVCDTNSAMWPPDLLAINGKRIGIPDPQD